MPREELWLQPNVVVWLKYEVVLLGERHLIGHAKAVALIVVVTSNVVNANALTIFFIMIISPMVFCFVMFAFYYALCHRSVTPFFLFGCLLCVYDNIAGVTKPSHIKGIIRKKDLTEISHLCQVF